MTEPITGAALDALTKLVKSRVEGLDISKETKALLLYVLDNASALGDFAITYAQQKAEGKVRPDKLMLKFLAARGKSLADFGIKLIDSEKVSDAAAVVILLMDIKDSLKYAADGPIGLALTVGFLINDGVDFLNNFTPAQRKYYELFIQQSDLKLEIDSPRTGQRRP